MEPMNEWIKMQAEVRPFIAERPEISFEAVGGELRVQDTKGEYLTRRYDRSVVRDLLIYLRGDSLVFDGRRFDGRQELVVISDPDEAGVQGMEIHVETPMYAHTTPTEQEQSRPIRF